ncbi:MAG: 3'-5' exonuclease [Kiritimatiellae bacterium]|jgi:DNA polymerase III epsilon subunit-like protein|nr:3'-5' exonuclease [Kiritimatiellia bacterium]
MNVNEVKYIAIDFETTGHVKGYKAEPWQIGCVFMDNAKVNPKTQFESLIRVGNRPFSIYAPGRYEELREEISVAPDMQELWPKIKILFAQADIAVAHNIPTEKNILGEYYPFLNNIQWVDTLTLARKIYPNVTDYSLSELLRGLNLYDAVYEMCPEKEEHDALFDAVGCGLLLEHFLCLPGWNSISVEKLMKLG